MSPESVEPLGIWKVKQLKMLHDQLLGSARNGRQKGMPERLIKAREGAQDCRVRLSPGGWQTDVVLGNEAIRWPVQFMSPIPGGAPWGGRVSKWIARWDRERI